MLLTKLHIIGVTGHRFLPVQQIPSIILKVNAALQQCINSAGGIIMLNALAVGADTLFFNRAIALDIPVHALLPLPVNDYQNDFANDTDKHSFLNNLRLCSKVETIPGNFPRPVCYQKLGIEIVNRCDTLIAIWDGKAANGIGGTGEVVENAKTQNKPIILIQ